MAAAVLSRATPATNMNSSQAQTSAPVFEYRCMFTHDIRKKAKKWHDGTLRFHTFNKRVMVYDDTKNLVGSLHYRSHEEFAEGLELNLDSHVLVQVEDRLGETSTDLTPLLGRHQQDGSSQSVRADPPTRATLSRINAANSQIKPKSIKELLAGSQGQIGRAHIPSKSPYEQKHPLVESQPTYPNSKRRKVDNGKENENVVIPGTRQVAGNTIERVATVPLSDTVVVDISSGDESHPTPPAKQKKLNSQPVPRKPRETSSIRTTTPEAARKKTITAASHNRSSRRSDVRDDSESPSPPPPKEKQAAPTKNKKVSKTTTRPQPTHSPSSRSPVVETYTPPIRHSSGPRSSLKFAAEKRRPKLMYRALLENSSKPASSGHKGIAIRDSTCDTTPDSDNEPEQVTRRPRLTNLIEADRMFAPSQIDREADSQTGEACDYAASLSPPSNSDPAVTKDTTGISDQARDQAILVPFNDEVTETIPDSPLFLPRTTSQLSPSQPRNLVVDDDHFSLLSQALQQTTPKSLRTSPGVRPMSPSSVENPLQNSLSATSSPLFQRRRSIDEEMEQAVEVQMSPSRDRDPGPSSLRLPESKRESLPSPRRVLPPQVRLFRRVVSESIPPTRTSPEAVSVNDSPEEDNPDNMLKDPSLDQTSPKTRSLPPQPQSFSDPVDIHSKSPVPRPTSSPPDLGEDLQALPIDDLPDIPPAPATSIAANTSVEESGPWTSTEAFLLFDRWPPGRQKPSYAKATTHDMSAPGTRHDGSNGGSKPQQNPATSMMSKKKYGTFGSAKFVSQR